MWLYSRGVCLRRSAYCSMQYCSNQLQGGLAQSMALWKCSHSQSRIYHVKSSGPQSIKYFVSLMGQQFRCRLSTREASLSIKLDMPLRDKCSRIGWNWRGMHQKIGGAAGGLCFGFSVTEQASAEIPIIRCSDDAQCSSSFTSSTHGKKVYTDYSVTGIPGDGRCLFRSVVHGACIRSGKPIPNEDLQRKLADELRTMVADEFVKRREETEWFVEGDFDTYVSHIRQPHVWGGEPELFIASHVLQMPITVYMHDEDEGGLIAIAGYGQQYGKEDPIQVLYHGYGHYDALQIPAERGPK